MAKIINRPADVTMGPGGTPRSFRWAGGQYQVVEVLDHWLEAGQWWEQETEMATWRVVTAGGGIFELTHRPAEKRWVLYKAYD